MAQWRARWVAVGRVRNKRSHASFGGEMTERGGQPDGGVTETAAGCFMISGV